MALSVERYTPGPKGPGDTRRWPRRRSRIRVRLVWPDLGLERWERCRVRGVRGCEATVRAGGQSVRIDLRSAGWRWS